jgi:hypothetical protein
MDRPTENGSASDGLKSSTERLDYAKPSTKRGDVRTTIRDAFLNFAVHFIIMIILPAGILLLMYYLSNGCHLR